MARRHSTHYEVLRAVRRRIILRYAAVFQASRKKRITVRAARNPTMATHAAINKKSDIREQCASVHPKLPSHAATDTFWHMMQVV